MDVTVWSAAEFVTEVILELNTAVSAVAGFEPPQFDPVFQSPPLAPDHVTLAAESDETQTVASAMSATSFIRVGKRTVVLVMMGDHGTAPWFAESSGRELGGSH